MVPVFSRRTPDGGTLDLYGVLAKYGNVRCPIKYGLSTIAAHSRATRPQPHRGRMYPILHRGRDVKPALPHALRTIYARLS